MYKYLKYILIFNFLFSDNEVCFEIESNPIQNEAGFGYFTKFIDVQAFPLLMPLRDSLFNQAPNVTLTIFGAEISTLLTNHANIHVLLLIGRTKPPDDET